MENGDSLIKKAGNPIEKKEVDFGVTIHTIARIQKEIDGHIKTKQPEGEVLDVLLDLKNILKEAEIANKDRFESDDSFSYKKTEVDRKRKVALDRLFELNPGIYHDLIDFEDDSGDDLKLKSTQLN